MCVLTPKQEWAFMQKFIKLGPDDCWEWIGSLRHGYGQLNINGKMCITSRIAWALEHGRWSTELILDHCDNKSCVNHNHLYEGTHSQNNIDRVRRGPLNDQQKLRPSDIYKIRELLNFGLPQQDIANRFGVDSRTISNINTGVGWSHVT